MMDYITYLINGGNMNDYIYYDQEYYLRPIHSIQHTIPMYCDECARECSWDKSEQKYYCAKCDVLILNEEEKAFSEAEYYYECYYANGVSDE